MKKNKKRVILVYPNMSSFVKQDKEILQKHFDIEIVKWRGKKDILKIFYGVINSDITFSWFATDHAFVTVLFSRLFRKKSIVIVGGGDVAYVPDLNYGQFTFKRYKKFLTKYALKHASKAFVVDLSLKEDAIKNAKVDGRNIEYIPTGYDSNYWKPQGEKDNIVLTVAGINKSIVKRKGLEIFVKAASHFPNMKFVLVGKHIDNSIGHLKSIATSNVEFTGFVPDEELLNWYQKAKVYCQLSRYEGLPNALCEAMLCECVPVGTEHCGIPTAIGDSGFYAPFGDVKATANAIKKALNNLELGKKARERIKKEFTIERREKELIREIK